MAETAHPEAQAEGSSQAPAADKTPVYEVSFHLAPSLDDAGVSSALEKIRKIIASNGKEESAEIIAEGFPQRMSLAYTIERAAQGKREKFNEAYFGWIKFATDRENIGEIEGSLRADKAVIRYLLIQTVREDLMQAPRRTVFASDRLEGKTLEKAPREAEKVGEVSEEQLDKSIEALTKE